MQWTFDGRGSDSSTCNEIPSYLNYAEELDLEAAKIDEDEYDRLFGKSNNKEFDGF